MKQSEMKALEQIRDALEELFENENVELKHINAVEEMIDNLEYLVENGDDWLD